LPGLILPESEVKR